MTSQVANTISSQHETFHALVGSDLFFKAPRGGWMNRWVDGLWISYEKIKLAQNQKKIHEGSSLENIVCVYLGAAHARGDDYIMAT